MIAMPIWLSIDSAKLCLKTSGSTTMTSAIAPQISEPATADHAPRRLRHHAFVHARALDARITSLSCPCSPVGRTISISTIIR